ncbi:MAG: PHP domain-containing protein, partial [Betaproteobacteria bacterium]|nr:PHP domain-containing protein [Betaproteobacteria bacterium]
MLKKNPHDSFPHDLNVDLHMHSSASDGALAPEAVITRAHFNGVRMLALTDHDTLAGQHEARETALALGLQYIHGVEISVTWGGATVHVVGLNFDPQSQVLNQV